MKIHLNYFKNILNFRIIHIIILLVIIGFVPTYATNYYVDNTSNGSNNGSSWTNAWESFSAINWSNIGTDTIVDTIFISGGSSSQVYYEQFNVPQNKLNVVITKGRSTGHNGEVIIDGESSRSYGIKLDANGGTLINITVSELTFQNCTWSGVYADGENSGGLRGLTIDNCKILNQMRAGIFIEGNNNYANNYDITISNCYINDLDGYTSQSDCIYLQWLSSARITKNKLILDNPANPGNTDWHSDDVQTYWVDTLIADNNYMYQSSQSKVLGTQTLFTQESHSWGLHIYYNNVIYANEPAKNDWTIRTKSNDGKIVYIINNPVIGYGRIQGSDAPGYLYNNIFYGKHTTGSYGDAFSSLGSPAARENNLVYDADGTFNSMSGSIEDNPMFTTTAYSTNWEGSLQGNSPAINAGGNYQSLIEGFGLEWKDINGIPRDSSPDIGAVSYNVSGGGNISPESGNKPKSRETEQ